MKRRWKIFIVIAFLIVLVALFIYYAFFDIQRLHGQENISESTSPDGAYTITAYLNNGGATTDYAVLGTLVNNKNGSKKNIYWNYPCSDANIKWIDNENVIINNVQLNVLKDTYDYRRR